MARTMQTRKRSAPVVLVRPSKKRRTNRRRGKKTSQWTSQKGGGAGISMRGRRQSVRTFKRMLWNATQAGTHFRSNFSLSTNLATTALPATMSPTVIASRRLGGNNFWVTAGGALNPDGGAMPTFATNTDITVRGGMFGIRIGNAPDALDTDKDAISCIVYLVKTTKAWSSTNVPASMNVGWDPTLVQDFQTNIGRVILRKNFLVNEGDCFTVERRMGISKIDQTEYAASINEFVWIVIVGNVTATAPKNLVVTTYFNLSFVGDTV